MSARRAVAIGAVLSLAVAPAPGLAQSPALPVPFPTPAEAAGYASFTAPSEVGPYLERLAAAVEGLEVGSLPGPMAIPVARVAPLVGAGEEGPVVRVLIIGAQHGTERAGAEAGLRVARDLAAGSLARLRRRLDVRIVPMANPRGVEARRRGTEAGVDLDRDHVRLAAPETRALWAEYAAWRPHLVIDLHEIGPTEYPVQIATPTHPNVPGVGRFARFYLLPYAANELAGADIPFHEYVAEWPDGQFAETAARPAPPESDTWFSPPPLDPSSARNAFALAGSVSFFVAVASSRDILGLAERTDRLHLAVEALLTAAAGLAPDLVAAWEAGRTLPKDPLALRFHYAAEDPGDALPWIFVNDRGQRERGRLVPWRSEVVVDAALAAPAGWWIPADHELADVLRAHGFEVGGAAPPVGAGALRAYEYPRCPDLAGPDAGAAPEAGDPVERTRDALRPVEVVDPDGAAEPLPAEALWVAADQPGARLLFAIVEPWSEGGWFDPVDCGDAPPLRVIRAAP